MSWFGGLAAANNRESQGQQVQPPAPANPAAQLLVPDPPLPENMAPPVNYDAKHEDDEAAGAMEKTVNMLRNFPWNNEDLSTSQAKADKGIRSMRKC